jgi:hypothetical protein
VRAYHQSCEEEEEEEEEEETKSIYFVLPNAH